MAWFLDTNMVVFCLRGKSAEVMRQLNATPASEVFIPAQVRAELLVGAAKSARAAQNKSAVLSFIAPFTGVWPGEQTTDHDVSIRVDLEAKGQAISEADLWIAATARSRHGILVTNNTSEFQRVSGLPVEDWSKL
jgi:tRNA(fMet)-specific endonuclease VapC